MRTVIEFKKQKIGSIVIIGMPIGNFEDVSPRALATLKECSVILCEDTRSSVVFFKHFNIDKSLISYVGSYDKAIAVAQKEISQNAKVGVICDRGMVGISDPGAKVIAHFRAQKVKIECVPGPSALTTAFALSGYFGNFIFHGFMPRKKNEIVELINKIKDLEYNLVFFESPLRIKKTLEILEQLLPTREITIARELTKQYESVVAGMIKDIKDLEFKGELVLIIKKE